MSDPVETTEHQDKKARIEEKEEPAVVYATPQTLCVVVISEEGTRSYYWNQGGELNDAEKKLIGNFLKPTDNNKEDNNKWLASVESCHVFRNLVSDAKIDFEEMLKFLNEQDSTITMDDLKSVRAANAKWDTKVADKQFKQRTKDGELPLRMVFVDEWC